MVNVRANVHDTRASWFMLSKMFAVICSRLFIIIFRHAYLTHGKFLIQIYVFHRLPTYLLDIYSSRRTLLRLRLSFFFFQFDFVSISSSAARISFPFAHELKRESFHVLESHENQMDCHWNGYIQISIKSRFAFCWLYKSCMQVGPYRNADTPRFSVPLTRNGRPPANLVCNEYRSFWSKTFFVRNATAPIYSSHNTHTYVCAMLIPCRCHAFYLQCKIYLRSLHAFLPNVI